LTGLGENSDGVPGKAGIPDRLNKLITEQGIPSASEFARRCKLKESTVRSYTAGTRYPPLEVCWKIGQALGVSGDWLFRGIGLREAERTAYFEDTPSPTVAELDVDFLERLAAATLKELGHSEARSRQIAAAWIKLARRKGPALDDEVQVRAQTLVSVF
jgi:transcriptional regulator with XRE-family HTH domain